MSANNNQIGMIFIVIGMLIYSFHDLAVKIIADETTIFQLFITRAIVGVIVTMTCLKCLNYKIRVIPVYPKLTLIRCVLMVGSAITHKTVLIRRSFRSILVLLHVL